MNRTVCVTGPKFPQAENNTVFFGVYHNPDLGLSPGGPYSSPLFLWGRDSKDSIQAERGVDSKVPAQVQTL